MVLLAESGNSPPVVLTAERRGHGHAKPRGQPCDVVERPHHVGRALLIARIGGRVFDLDAPNCSEVRPQVRRVVDGGEGLTPASLA